MLTPWTQLPQAAALLADCAINPPASARELHRGLVNDVYLNVYDEADPRVRRLAAIRDRWGDEVWTPALKDVDGNGGAAAVFDAFIEVDAAISAAIEAASEVHFAEAAE